MFLRKQVLEGSRNESLFLWGARQTGKSTLIKLLFPEALWFDLLLSDTYLRYKSEPQQFRHLKGLKSFAEEYTVKRLIVVSDDPLERRMGEISVIPWKQFLEQLWRDEII